MVMLHAMTRKHSKVLAAMPVSVHVKEDRARRQKEVCG
jgi:hypothetical protein